MADLITTRKILHDISRFGLTWFGCNSTDLPHCQLTSHWWVEAAPRGTWVRYEEPLAGGLA
jgi:hypothetical protein